MERKLKDFFQRTGSRRKHTQPSSQAEQKPELARVEQKPEPHSSQLPSRFMSISMHPEDSNRTSRDRTASGGKVVNSATGNNSHPMLVENEQSDRLGKEDSIADDYAAYQPILFPTEAPYDPQYMTLGGDTRLMTDASMLRHNEDVADRNIERFGSRHGSRNSSMDTGDKHAARTSLRNASLGGSSIGTSSFGKTSIRMVPTSKDDPRESTSPVVESSSPKMHHWNRHYWPVRIPRDEQHQTWRMRKSTPNEDNIPQRNRSSNLGQQRNLRTSDLEATDLRKAFMDGARDNGTESQHNGGPVQKPSLAGIVDLNDSVHVDKTYRCAPAVTHEVVKPRVHHVREEQIHREVHNYDVYHRIQPIYETEVLPARHFIPDLNGDSFIEVSEDQLPGCTGVNQRWFIGEREQGIHGTPRKRLTAPKIASETTYTAPEGFERTETTIVHPPTLEDMSRYRGPVLHMHFYDDQIQDSEVLPSDEALDSVPDGVPVTLKELTDTLPAVPPRTSSVQKPIVRKPTLRKTREEVV